MVTVKLQKWMRDIDGAFVLKHQIGPWHLFGKNQRNTKGSQKQLFTAPDSVLVAQDHVGSRILSFRPALHIFGRFLL
jgi:hypothetical protein